MNCNAQTGFNAKRFIVQSSVYEEFKERLIAIIKRKTVIGDPLDPNTTLGPMARID
jgi:acyl-CoA reductase-like NAD-dependent aldehyde dehydrogenase